MSVVRAMNVLQRLGFSKEQFEVLHKFFRQHGHDAFKGGQHTNCGCHDGRCDYGFHRKKNREAV